MGAFIVIVIGVVAGVAFFMSYVSRRTASFPLVQSLMGGRKRLAFWVCFAVWALLFFLLGLLIGSVNSVICMVHLAGFWLLSELFFYLLKRGTHKSFREYLPGVCAILFTIRYMIIAWYLCTHVWEKDYSLESDALKGDLRIVQFADSHVGATFHAQKFRDYMLAINALHPDLVVVTGDFVDDDTSREDMIGSCEALGELETSYGVYFCYGNHDKGYFNDEAKGWTNDDLMENLAKNDVIVLQDEVRLIDDRFYVIGRQDKSEEDRGAGRFRGAFRVDASVHQDGVRNFHVVRRAVGPLYKIHIIIQRVHRALQENTGGQHCRCPEGSQGGPRQPGITDPEQGGTDGGGPGVGRRQLQRLLRSERLVFVFRLHRSYQSVL